MRLGIVGAGQAACTLIAELIRGQFEGEILVFNGEPHIPYQRPPLSKAWLQEMNDVDSLGLLPDPIKNHESVRWIPSRVTAIKPDTGTLITNDDEFQVDHIVLATGTRAKHLNIDGLPINRMHMIRTLDDALGLREAMDGCNHVTIIGAGFLAFELAASLNHPSRNIRILAKGHRALPQVSVKTADRLVDATPTSVRVGVTIDRYDEDSEALITNHGTIPSQLVIIAVGATPNTELAAQHGIGTHEGIPTDAYMQTKHPNVSAIGEVSLHHQPHLGTAERIESISEANDSAATLAKRLLGSPSPFHAIPWFWSDQGDLKLQIAGLSSRNDHETCLTETETECVVIRHKRDKVTAIEAINSAREFMAARRLFEQGDVSLDAILQAGSVFQLLQSSRS
jgi:3-phenylpropionate/trans-cinnamate dioxygenase ferredoxin reductase subunit